MPTSKRKPCVETTVRFLYVKDVDVLTKRTKPSLYLQHAVGGVADPGHDVGRGERSLLHVLEVVHRVAVEVELAHLWGERRAMLKMQHC